MMPASFRFGAGVVLLFSAACGGSEPIGDVPPGTVDVVLQQGALDLGGMVFEINGGVVDSVTAAGYTTYSAPHSGTATRVLLAGTIAPGLVAHAYLHNSENPAAFSVTLLEAADATSFALLDVSGLRLKLQR